MQRHARQRTETQTDGHTDKQKTKTFKHKQTYTPKKIIKGKSDLFIPPKTKDIAMFQDNHAVSFNLNAVDKHARRSV